MNSSQNSAFSYKNNRPLSWPVIHANIITHSHVHGVSFFVPFCSRICSTFVPKKQSYFANLVFGSNVRFPAPILDIHIITHSHVRCVTYFSHFCHWVFPKNSRKTNRMICYYLEITRIFWKPAGTCGYFPRSRQTHPVGFVPAEADQDCAQPRNQETPTR